MNSGFANRARASSAAAPYDPWSPLHFGTSLGSATCAHREPFDTSTCRARRKLASKARLGRALAQSREHPVTPSEGGPPKPTAVATEGPVGTVPTQSLRYNPLAERPRGCGG